MHSTRIKTASASWNACKRPCVSQTLLPRRLSLCNYTAIHWTSIFSTLIVEHLPYVLLHLRYMNDTALIRKPQVTPKFVNSLVELITQNIDNISSPDVHPTQRAPPGLLEGVQTPEMITRHFRNTLSYIQNKKAQAAAEGGAGSRWDDVDVVGAFLKMGITR